MREDWRKNYFKRDIFFLGDRRSFQLTFILI